LRRIHLQEAPTSIKLLQIQPTVHIIGKSSDVRLFTHFACAPQETYTLQLTHKQLLYKAATLNTKKYHKQNPQVSTGDTAAACYHFTYVSCSTWSSIKEIRGQMTIPVYPV